jgi:hypothetical protein
MSKSTQYASKSRHRRKALRLQKLQLLKGESGVCLVIAFFTLCDDRPITEPTGPDAATLTADLLIETDLRRHPNILSMVDAYMLEMPLSSLPSVHDLDGQSEVENVFKKKMFYITGHTKEVCFNLYSSDF